ncbi:MAG: rhomboid family intramembrane serine protease [Rhodospirillales bacterium]|nr:rhomboid family intramembrane serine protease [Alphaproteobacteria bacterium]MCB9986314.1 rhomboid family intramembrane serine protease [Rhodospirillales bacterium]USO07133.1 MAG: rhomboid family intramembrane serine protease [Rhodospirillales bacterium]
MSVTPFKRPSNQNQPPLLNLPPLTAWTLTLLVAIEIALKFGPADVVLPLAYRFTFIAARFTVPGLWQDSAVLTPVTYLFIHGGWLHVAMNGLMLMAFGAACERMLGAKRTAILFLASGIVAAAAEFAIAPHSTQPMVGASGALSGLFAYVILRLQADGRMQAGRYGIWGVAALWIGLSLAMSAMGNFIGVGDVAWAAHAGGFIAGVLLARLRYFA